MSTAALGAELELLTASDVARMLGCSRQNVHQLAQAAEAGVSRSGFPEPAIRVPYGPLWSREVLERWAERRRQTRGNGAQDAD